MRAVSSRASAASRNACSGAFASTTTCLPPGSQTTRSGRSTPPSSVATLRCSAKSQCAVIPASSTTRLSCSSPHRPRVCGWRSAPASARVSPASWRSCSSSARAPAPAPARSPPASRPSARARRRSGRAPAAGRRAGEQRECGAERERRAEGLRGVTRQKVARPSDNVQGGLQRDGSASLARTQE